MDKISTKDLQEKLFYKPCNVYDHMNSTDEAAMETMSQSYIRFLAEAKTEREAVAYAVRRAKENGFSEYQFGQPVKAGDKLYFNNRGKSIYLFRVGSEPIEEGLRITAAHVDSPRVDLKQNPLYEDGNMGFFKTHYYGGIKKYQWTTVPLALHGVVIKKDGTSVDIKIGEEAGDPIFYINDLLPHLAADQMRKTMAEGIGGESLNILIGSKPYEDREATDRIKLNLLSLLYDKYGIAEADFMSAELCAVPAFPPREIGFDRSLIGGYGHDDRVCAFPALEALFDTDDSAHTCMVILADKEEIGSDGNTGMKTWCFVDIINELADALGGNANTVRMHSKCLSADVNAAFDPNFKDVYEPKNASFVNHGVVLTKYTGSRGKSGTNDASAEYVAFVRQLFDKAGVVYQTAELGKVDIGGGGTVAKYIAEKNIEVVDLGVAVVSMHAPYEVIAKADLYMTYKGMCAFNQ
ncbi:MAG: aminopeptidase [Clostridiales bacterium]|nr:aminopeptidase [Clostridiales bacterium]